MPSPLCYGSGPQVQFLSQARRNSAQNKEKALSTACKPDTRNAETRHVGVQAAIPNSILDPLNTRNYPLLPNLNPFLLKKKNENKTDHQVEFSLTISSAHFRSARCPGWVSQPQSDILYWKVPGLGMQQRASQGLPKAMRGYRRLQASTVRY